MISIQGIAKVAHEANRAYCQILGDNSQYPWHIAPDWQKDSAVSGVMSIQTGEITKPEESHKNWLKEKEKDGWIFGEEKNTEEKRHPCMVPFDKLSEEQQMKDHLFFQIVSILLG